MENICDKARGAQRDKDAKRKTLDFLEELKAGNEVISAGARPFKLSLTLGMAHYDPLKHIELEHLVMIADEEMYRQKRKRTASVP